MPGTPRSASPDTAIDGDLVDLGLLAELNTSEERVSNDQDPFFSLGHAHVAASPPPELRACSVCGRRYNYLSLNSFGECRSCTSPSIAPKQVVAKPVKLRGGYIFRTTKLASTLLAVVLLVAFVIFKIGIAVDKQNADDAKRRSNESQRQSSEQFERAHPPWSDVVDNDTILQSYIRRFPDLADDIRSHNDRAQQQLQALYSAGGGETITLGEMDHFNDVWLYEGVPH